MNFFDFLFKKKEANEPAHHLPLPNENLESIPSKVSDTISLEQPKDSPWNLAILLLQAFNKQPLTNPHNLNPTLSRQLPEKERYLQFFLSEGYLQVSSIGDILEMKYTVQQLKQRLREASERIIGRKSELIERLIAILQPAEREDLKSESFYMLTESGRELVRVDQDRFEKYVSLVAAEAERLFENQEIEQGCKIIFDLLDSSPISIGIGRDSQREFEIVQEIMTSEFLTSTLVGNISQQNMLKAKISSHYLLNGLTNKKLSKEVLDFWPDFDCEYVKEFLATSPIGIFSEYDPNCEEELLEVFHHFFLFRCINKVALRKYLLEPRIKRTKGISVIGSNHCEKCNGKEIRYTWAQIDELPAIPHFPGCICIYSTWT